MKSMKKDFMVLSLFPVSITTDDTAVVAFGVGIFALGFISSFAISKLWDIYSKKTSSKEDQPVNPTSSSKETQCEELDSSVSDNLSASAAEKKIVDDLESKLLANVENLSQSDLYDGSHRSTTSDLDDDSHRSTTSEVDALGEVDVLGEVDALGEADRYYAYTRKAEEYFFYHLDYTPDWCYLSFDFDIIQQLNFPLFSAALFGLLSILPYLRLRMEQWYSLLESLENIPSHLFKSLDIDTQLYLSNQKRTLRKLLFPPMTEEENFTFSDSSE